MAEPSQPAQPANLQARSAEPAGREAAEPACILDVMPLYEYECRGCQHRFELLVRDSTVLACPSCSSQELEKQLSVFAVKANGPSFSAAECAGAVRGVRRSARTRIVFGELSRRLTRQSPPPPLN